MEELALNSCDCQLMTRDELKALVHSERSDQRARAVAHLASLPRDEETRRHGYELFREGLADALFCSCLDYGSLATGSPVRWSIS